MKEKKFVSTRKLFLKLTLVFFIISVVTAYFVSTYMRDAALNNLAEDDAKKTSEFVFEILYTKMQDGWAREDLYKIIHRLNTLKPGLEIHTYRSTLVEELFGEIDSEKKNAADPFIQRALKGETLFVTNDNNTIRYIRPMIIKDECITCHYNTKAGDVNGVIDMTFPDADIKIPLDTIIFYFLLFTVIAIILTFFTFQFLMTRTFINPITAFVQSIANVINSADYSKSIESLPKTYEMYVLKKTFNELLSKVNQTLEELKYKNKILQEYKKAIDRSTIVSKTNHKGTITYVNDRFCEISGYTKDELIGKNHNIVRSPNVSKKIFKELWSTIENKKAWRGALENRAKNGDSYFVQATIMPILDDNNNVVEYIGIRQDITELKKLQFNEINDSVDKALKVHLQDIVEFLPVCSVIIDKDSNILYTNNNFNTKFSYLNGEKISLDSLFIQKDGYISSNEVLDWRDEVSTLQDSCTQKVLISIFDEYSEFYISIKELDLHEVYLVLFFDIDSNPYD